MKNKYLSFIKNSLISSAAVIGAGIGVSELAADFTDNGKIIGALSTIAGYAAGWAAFLPLQAIDNRENYMQNERFNTKRFITDNIKLGVPLIMLDGAYLLARPFMQDYLIDSGVSESRSSLFSDMIFLPVYITAAVFLARKIGLIPRAGKSLEDKVK